MKDLTGQRFGKLIVIKEGERELGNIRNLRRWWCQCDCGSPEKLIRQNSLTSTNDKKNIRSCGCVHKKAVTKSSTIHGRSKIKDITYRSWQCMRDRCLNPNHKNYKHYGGRGISIDDSWNSFEVFLKDMGERPTKMHTLERINNSIGYSPSNCRWATKEEQANNTRRNVYLTYEGLTLSVSQWSRKLNLSRHTLTKRISLGWSIYHILFGKD